MIYYLILAKIDIFYIHKNLIFLWHHPSFHLIFAKKQGAESVFSVPSPLLGIVFPFIRKKAAFRLLQSPQIWEHIFIYWIQAPHFHIRNTCGSPIRRKRRNDSERHPILP